MYFLALGQEMLAAFFALYGLYEGPFRPFSEARGMNIESSTKKGKKIEQGTTTTY